jgi:RNA-directed DNA polymerase
MSHTTTRNLWSDIEQAGGTDAYIKQQLKKQGFLVKRRPTDDMSQRERKNYKQQLKKEAAEKRRLKKEAWVAYQASHIVHLGENIYWNDNDDLDKWDIENAEERAAENELPALDAPQQLATLLDLTIPQLRWLAYHRDMASQIHYKQFTIAKRDGNAREIWAPLPILKRVQRTILRNILEKLSVHGASHGFLAGRSILSNAKVHTNSDIIVKMDLENFFPTITLPRIKGLFRKAGYRERIATLLALLCSESPRKVVEHESKPYYVSLGARCLPQGAPTSPAITNALCMSLDRRLSGAATKYGWRYSRYADDITFSLPEKAKLSKSSEGKHLGSILSLTKLIVEDEGFLINQQKTRITRANSRQQVTGLVVNGEQTPRVPRRIKRQLRAAIFNLKQGKPLAEGESVSTLQGYAAFIYMTDPKLGSQMLSELAPFT